MKFTFLTKPFFIVAVFLVIYAGLGLAAFRWQQDFNSMVSQTEDMKGVLAKPPAQNIDDLKAQLAAAQAERDQNLAVFPSEMKDTAIIARLLDMAKNSKVDVINITSSSKQVSAGYTALSFNLETRGTLKDLLGFLTSLDSRAEGLQALAIDSADFSAAKEPCTATIRVSAYARAAPK